jgi:hypothetical protein
MNYEAAHARARHLHSASPEERVVVEVPVRNGTHHTITLFERTRTGEYEQAWSEKTPTRLAGIEIRARVGDIVYQRSTSPASGDPLERYGVVAGDGHIDWGADADWVVDFGPMGDATRRAPRKPVSPFRSRLFAPSSSEEVVGGAVREAASTSGGGSD